MQQRTLNMQPATLYVKYATYHVKFVTSTSNTKRTRIFFILALSKTCNIERQTWNLDGQHTTTDVKHATCNTAHEIYNLSRKVCNFDVKHEMDKNIQEYSLFWLYPKHAISNVKHETGTTGMQQQTLNMQPATCNTAHEICNLSRKVCNFDVKHETDGNIREYSLFWLYSKHATSNVKIESGTADMQQQKLNMQPATLHVKYATYHVKFATSTLNMKRTRIFENIFYFGFIQNMQHRMSNMKPGRPACNNRR